MIRKLGVKQIRWLIAISATFAVLIAFFAAIKPEEATEKGNGALFDISVLRQSEAESDHLFSNTQTPYPQEFELIAETQTLSLQVHRETAHFIVTDKRNGRQWRSFADPEDWSEEDSEQSKMSLRSPIGFQYVNMDQRKDLAIESNLLKEQANIQSFEIVDNGFQVVFDIPRLGIHIPIEIRIQEDYIEMSIQDEDLNEPDGSGIRLISLRPYPFFGSVTSENRDGFLFIPDGPGALIRFTGQLSTGRGYYHERVYGGDMAFSHRRVMSTRQKVTLPVYGMQNGSGGFLAVIHDGEEYANIFAAPSGSTNRYNWISVEFLYRQRYFQSTNFDKTEGYFVYSPERFKGNRKVRYYLLEDEAADYVDMAKRYQIYLMEEYGMVAQDGASANTPLHLEMYGGDQKPGFFWDSYLPLTSFSQAKEIITSFLDRGISRLSVVFKAWQKGGAGTYGEHFPVEKELGGNRGLQDLQEFAQTHDVELFLDAGAYAYNNTGDYGFQSRRDALYDLGSNVIKRESFISDETLTQVSPKWMTQNILNDLKYAKNLGINGFVYPPDISRNLSSDFGRNHAVRRDEAMALQSNLVHETLSTLGHARVSNGNVYSLKDVDHIYAMPAYYSYDLFVDETVPFYPMVMRGLKTYSLSPANLSDNYQVHLLKSIEYGAELAYAVFYQPGTTVRNAMNLKFLYSMNHEDWFEEMIDQYNRVKGLLDSVRGMRMTDHQKLQEGVYETTYESGIQVIVNYNDRTVEVSGDQVQAKDFLVIQGGGNHR